MSEDEQKPCICELCNRCFTDNVELEEHYNEHTLDSSEFNTRARNDNPLPQTTYRCGICGQFFDSGKELSDHSITHIPDEIFSCDICNKPFITQDEIREHYDTVHNNNKPYKCETCGKGFILPKTPEKHRKIHIVGKPYK